MIGQLHRLNLQVASFFPCCCSSLGRWSNLKKIIKYAYLHIFNAIPPRAVLTKKLENKDKEHCEKKIQEIVDRTSSQSLGINLSKQVFVISQIKCHVTKLRVFQKHEGKIRPIPHRVFSMTILD
jgi:hypothetical protein